MDGNYKAYLLRIWQVGEGTSPGWRAMLEDPRTHETIGFSSVVELMQFLKENENAGLSEDKKSSTDENN